MSDLQQVSKSLASRSKRKQDQEQFDTYEKLRIQREAAHAKVQAIDREWKLLLGDVAQVVKPEPLTPEEKLDLENKNQEFLASVRVALSLLKAKDDVWQAEDTASTFERQKVRDVLLIENKLFADVNKKTSTWTFFESKMSDATVLPYMIGDLSPEATLQAYRDYFRAKGLKRLFTEC